MKKLKYIFLIVVVALLAARVVSAIQPGTNTWDKPEFGIKFTVVGPYVFFEEKTNIKKKTASVAFMRKGKGKRGLASLAPLTESDLPLSEISIENSKQFSSLNNVRTEYRKTITAGEAPAILIVFSYDEIGSNTGVRGSGYLVVSDLNDLRYMVWVLNWDGNDPIEDEELGGIINTLEITKTQ